MKTCSHSTNASARALKAICFSMQAIPTANTTSRAKQRLILCSECSKNRKNQLPMSLKEQMAGKWYTEHLLARHMATTRSMMDLVCTRAWTWVPNGVTKFTRLPVTSAIFDPSKNSPPHPKNYFVRLLRVALVKCLRPHLIWNLVDCDVFPHLREIWRFLRI